MATHYKLVVYVPLSHADRVREAIGKADGGELGKYSFCSFTVRGTGRFKPEEGAHPYRVHPYEEVAYDLYPLEVWE